MIAVPADTPVTIPVRLATVAFDGLLLLHVPPVAVFDNVVVNPAHTDDVPDIAEGAPLTVTTTVAGVPQPFV